MTSTLTQAGGAGLAPGDFIITNTTEGRHYLVTDIDSETTLTFIKMEWWITVLSWNPCNNILELI